MYTKLVVETISANLTYNCQFSLIQKSKKKTLNRQISTNGNKILLLIATQFFTQSHQRNF